ncbi:HlyD family efflux transporter periplasmic adaptor subunit [bacterium]|nr:MAG: HlyD family efflux transporter periplasmic adaptor subunit [bacterium]
MQKKWIYSSLVVILVLAAWFYFSDDDTQKAEIIIQPTIGAFEVRVTNTGELRAQNSTEIMGPAGARQVGIWNLKIQRLIPEGTVVDSGAFVAELDRSELMGKIQDAQLSLQKVQSQVEQAKLDCTLTLSEARDNLINLKYGVEERQLALDQAQYESPAVQRQAEIDYEKSQRSLAQATRNYETKVLQAKAKISEVEADLSKEQRKMGDLQKIMSQFVVNAPKKGMVVYSREWNGKKRNVGSTVSPWDPTVAELPDLSVMESITYINEVDIQKVREKQVVEVGLDANPDKKLSGIVTSVANIGEQRPNSDSKVFEVKIQVNESDTTLRPAMTTSNSILVTKMENVLFIPLESIHSNDSLSYVFKKDGLSTLRQEITLGDINETHAIILKGIEQSDRLFLSTPEDTTGLKWSYLPKESENLTSNK